MKHNVKITSLILVTAMATLFFAGCAGKSTTETTAPSAKAPEKIRIAIVQPLSHTSLDQIRETIVTELEASDVDFEIVTLNANGDTSSLSTILSNQKSKGVDIVVPIATSTAQSAKVVFDGDKTPIIFAAVSDPVAAGLTGDDSKNITGVSNSIPAAEIVKLISNFQPGFKKIGFLYTSSEANSVSTINNAKAYCDANGVAYEESSIAALSDLQSAVNSLLFKGSGCSLYR